MRELPPEGSALAVRCRQLRRQRGLKLEEVAAKARLTKSYLSKVERGLTVPSIGSAARIARAFGVPLTDLIDGARYAPVTVIKRAERSPLVRAGSRAGYHYEVLGSGTLKTLDAFIMRPPRQPRGSPWFEHAGEEFLHVLRGRMEMVLPDRRLLLNAGDSLSLHPHVRHRSRSLSARPAEVLVVEAVREDRGDRERT